ncbi:MAG: dimethylsulfonioproprionate lyase family protein, partial [Alphaproteobacteria bacterium]
AEAARRADTCPEQPGRLPPHLSQALAAPGADPLTHLLAPLAPTLTWPDTSTDMIMPEGFRGRYSFTEIIAPDGMVPAVDFRFGAYLLHPHTWYPPHHHAAEELYFILSGTARWTRDGVDGQPEPPGTLIHHASHERHATRTLHEPLLALWIWLGDIDSGSYRIEGG